MSLLNVTRSELTKVTTTAMWWILALVLFVYIGATAAGLAAAFGAELPGGPPTGDDGGLPALVYSLATALGYVFPLLIGTLMVTAEFRHATLTPTFLATPRRGLALSGKAFAGVVMGVVYGLVALASSVIPGAAILAATGVDPALGDTDTWALLGRMLVAYVLWVLIGIGIGTLLRNQVAAIVVVIAFTQFVEPIVRTLAGIVDVLGDLAPFLPGAASDGLVGASLYTSIAGATGGGTELEWWASGLVLAGYALVLLVAGFLASWRRDVA